MGYLIKLIQLMLLVNICTLTVQADLSKEGKEKLSNIIAAMKKDQEMIEQKRKEVESKEVLMRKSTKELVQNLQEVLRTFELYIKKNKELLEELK